MEQSKRSAICKLRRTGHSPAHIAKSLQYPRQTVYNVCKRFESSGHVQRSPHKSRSDKILTSRFLAGFKRSSKANPITSFSTLAKKKAVSETCIHRGIKQLGLKPYAQGKRRLLTTKMKEVRLVRCFFSSAVQPAMTTKHPVSVMSICIVSSEGDVFTRFFAPKEKLNAEVYSRVLEDKILPWMNDTATGKNYVFQQDSAPAHTAKQTIKLLKRSNVRFWEKDFWPSNSPDLNPLDYYFWERIEAKAFARPHNSIKTLKKDIIKSVASLERAEII